MLQESKKIMLEVYEEEKVLLDLLRKIDYGEVTIIMRHGRPERVVETKRSHKLCMNPEAKS